MPSINYADHSRTSQLVDDLLDSARILSGKLQLQPTRISVADPLRAAVDIVQSAADAKGIELAVEIESSVLPLQADAMRLQQVLWNVLSNAIKFTPDHGVVHVNVRQIESDVEIVVQDPGRGIPAELDLAIVKYVVEAHGGSVRADSAGEGRGATFTMRLPLTSSDTVALLETLPSTAWESSTSDLNGARILVVDDDADRREVMTAHLEQHGATVVAAASAQEALAIVQQQPLGALLVDIAMPGQVKTCIPQLCRTSAVRPSPSACRQTGNCIRGHPRRCVFRSGMTFSLRPLQGRTAPGANAKVRGFEARRKAHSEARSSVLRRRRGHPRGMP
jgi:Histidine kinase-, DNA gyrase B-, and HSP90-like ATPase/Response regulator receiver domain